MSTYLSSPCMSLTIKLQARGKTYFGVMTSVYLCVCVCVCVLAKTAFYYKNSTHNISFYVVAIRNIFLINYITKQKRI